MKTDVKIRLHPIPTPVATSLFFEQNSVRKMLELVGQTHLQLWVDPQSKLCSIRYHENIDYKDCRQDQRRLIC